MTATKRHHGLPAFLTKEEAAIIIAHIERDRADAQTEKFGFKEMIYHFRDWKCWEFASYVMLNNVALYAFRLLPAEDSQRWLQLRHCKSSAIHLPTIRSRPGLDVCRIVVLRPLQDSWPCHDLQQRSVHHWTDYDGLVHHYRYQICRSVHRGHGHLRECTYQLRLSAQQYRGPVEASSLPGNDGHWRCIWRHHLWQHLPRRGCPTLRSSSHCVYMFPGTLLTPVGTA